MLAADGTIGSRALRFFFMHLGSLVAVIVYFHLYGASGYSEEGLRSALLTALVVKSGYMALAYWYGEHKHFDFGILAGCARQASGGSCRRDGSMRALQPKSALRPGCSFKVSRWPGCGA